MCLVLTFFILQSSIRRMLLVQRQNSNVEDKSQSVLFIFEIEICLLTPRRFTVWISSNHAGPVDEQVLMCRYQPEYIDSHAGDMKAVQILVVHNLRIRNKRPLFFNKKNAWRQNSNVEVRRMRVVHCRKMYATTRCFNSEYAITNVIKWKGRAELINKL